MNEADVSLITYCGLHCGDCPNHSGEIADLARDLRKKLREYHFERLQGLPRSSSHSPTMSRVTRPLGRW
jgi:hypothetical protein